MSFGDLKVQDLIYEDSSNNEITVVIADLATKANPTFTGTVTVPTAPASDVSTKAASTAFVDSYYATKASPVFSGTPTVPGYAPLAGAAFTGTVTGTNLTLSGNLVVNGTTTTINTQTLDVEDRNITMGNVSSPSNTTAEAGGLTLKGGSDGDKTLNWLAAPGFGVTQGWTSSENLCIASGKIFYSASTTTNKYLRVYAGGTTGLWDIYGNGANLEFMDHANSGSVIFNRDARLIDAKHIKFGAGDDMRLYSDGTYGYIQGDELRIGTASNTTSAVFTNTKFDFRKDVDLTNSAKLGIGGAYGTSGQVLTSGGSGAAPSWAAVPAGGNTFTAIANGSIANNKAVKIDTDGKVSQVKMTTTAVTGNPPNPRAYHTDTSAHDLVLNSWNANQNKMVVLHKFTSGAGGTLGARVGTIGTALDSSSFSVGNIQTMCTTPGTDAAVGYDPNTYQHLFVYNDDSKTNDKLCARLGTISGNGISYGTQVDLYTADTAGYTPSVMYDDSNDKFIVVYRNSSFKLTAVVGTVSGTNISFSSPVSSTDTHTLYGQSMGMKAAFDTNQNKVLAVFPDGDLSAGRLSYCVGSISSGSISWGTVAQLSSTNADYLDMAFGETNNKFVIVFRGTSDNNYARVFSAYINSGATTASASSEMYFRSSTTTSGQNIMGKSIAWDSSSNLFGVYAVNSTPSTKVSFITYLSDGSNTITQLGATAYENLTYASSHQRVAIASMGSHGAFVTAGMRTSDNYARYGVWNSVVGTSNLVGNDHYVGFADQAYTNGQTATIKTYGNHVDTLSGLTAGTKYYVQGDGTVGTSAASPTTRAGIAIGTTKLLIQEPTNWGG